MSHRITLLHSNPIRTFWLWHWHQLQTSSWLNSLWKTSAFFSTFPLFIFLQPLISFKPRKDRTNVQKKLKQQNSEFCRSQQATFIPFIIKSFGGFTETATKLINLIVSLFFHFQQFSVILWNRSSRRYRHCQSNRTFSFN